MIPRRGGAWVSNRFDCDPVTERTEHVASHRAEKDRCTIGFRDGRPRLPDTITDSLDAIQDAQAPAGKKIDIDPNPSGKHVNERQAVPQKSPGPIDLEPHHVQERRVGHPAAQVLVAITETPPRFARDVNPADVQVARDILPEVRQLQSGADGIGPGGVGFPSDNRTNTGQAARPDRRVSAAVVAQLVEGVVLLDPLVFLESGNQVRERFGRGWRIVRSSAARPRTPDGSPARRSTPPTAPATRPRARALPARPRPHRPDRRPSGNRRRRYRSVDAEIAEASTTRAENSRNGSGPTRRQ